MGAGGFTRCVAAGPAHERPDGQGVGRVPGNRSEQHERDGRIDFLQAVPSRPDPQYDRLFELLSGSQFVFAQRGFSIRAGNTGGDVSAVRLNGPRFALRSLH